MAAGQTAAWPTKPIRWIVNFPPAGAADIMSRALAEYFGTKLGQPIVVENKPGAGGMLGADIVAKARGDAHIVMISSAASHGIGPVLYKDVPYDPLADFTHIHLVGTFPSVLAVNGSSPIGSVQELIEIARAKPGEVTYGSGGNGTMNHLVGQLLALAAKAQLTHIPYRGSAPAMNDLIGGQVHLMADPMLSSLPHVKSGRLRALAVTSAKRTPLAPDVPTVAESGMQAFDMVSWYAVWAPKGLPADVSAYLSKNIAEVVNSDRFKQKLAPFGFEPDFKDSAALRAFVIDEMKRYDAIVKASKIQVQ